MLFPVNLGAQTSKHIINNGIKTLYHTKKLYAMEANILDKFLGHIVEIRNNV